MPLVCWDFSEGSFDSITDFREREIGEGDVRTISEVIIKSGINWLKLQNMFNSLAGLEKEIAIHRRDGQ